MLVKQQINYKIQDILKLINTNYIMIKVLLNSKRCKCLNLTHIIILIGLKIHF